MIPPSRLPRPIYETSSGAGTLQNGDQRPRIYIIAKDGTWVEPTIEASHIYIYITYARHLTDASSLYSKLSPLPCLSTTLI